MEIMERYEKATCRPYGYLMLDLKPSSDDQHRLKTNVSHAENDVLQPSLNKYIQKQSHRQYSILNAMYNTQQQMVNIMHSPQLTTPDEKKCTLLQ
jgi:hypothetical protein